MADKQLISQYDGTHVKVGDRFVRIDKGVAVPSGADEDHLAVLVERKMLAEGKPVAGFIDAATVPPFPGRGAHEGDGPDDVDGDGPIPTKSANKDVWVAYAVTKGATQEEAEASTKEDLIAAYGG